MNIHYDPIFQEEYIERLCEFYIFQQKFKGTMYFSISEDGSEFFKIENICRWKIKPLQKSIAGEYYQSAINNYPISKTPEGL